MADIINTGTDVIDVSIQSLLNELAPYRKEFLKHVDGITKNVDDIVNANLYAASDSVEQLHRNMDQLESNIEAAILEQAHLNQLFKEHLKSISDFLNTIEKALEAQKNEQSFNLLAFQMLQQEMINYLRLLQQQQFIKEIATLIDKIHSLRQKLQDINYKLGDILFNAISDLKNKGERYGYIPEFNNLKYDRHEMYDYVAKAVRDKVRSGVDMMVANKDAYREWASQALPEISIELRHKLADKESSATLPMLKENIDVDNAQNIKSELTNDISQQNHLLQQKSAQTTSQTILHLSNLIENYPNRDSEKPKIQLDDNKADGNSKLQKSSLSSMVPKEAEKPRGSIQRNPISNGANLSVSQNKEDPQNQPIAEERKSRRNFKI